METEYMRLWTGRRACHARWALLVASLSGVVLLPAVGSVSAQPENETGPLRSIAISFKLDPRMSGGTYGGERWVSPPTFTSPAQGGDTATVTAKVEGIDAKGGLVSISPEWTAADPEMVTVAADGKLYRITVKHPGESRLRVAARGASQELVVRARRLGEALQVDIVQDSSKRTEESPKPAPQEADSSTPAAPVADGGAASPLKDEAARESYALGVATARRLKAQFPELHADLVSRGVSDGLSGALALASEDEIRAALVKLGSEARTKQADARKALAEKNKNEGEAFLAQNKAKKGVVTLESGLQYKVLRAGVGKKPVPTDSVVCHYRGTFVDGREFDSSYGRGKPATFALNRIIKGWSEALQLMPAGSKWQIVVPSSLAYGARGARGTIGPNATLVFEVELISVAPRSEASQPPPGPAPGKMAKDQPTVQ